MVTGSRWMLEEGRRRKIYVHQYSSFLFSLSHTKRIVEANECQSLCSTRFVIT